MLFVLTIASAAFVSSAAHPSATAQSNNLSSESKSTLWGVSSSSSSFRNHGEWFPKMSAAGVTIVRLFPEWRGLEPANGMWKWEQADALVKSALDNKIEINAIFMGSTPWSKAKPHAFPMDNLDD
jgi:hypothetical protein